MSRRTMVKTALAVGLVATGFPKIGPASTALNTKAMAAESESTEMLPTELINALKTIGKPVCLEAADRLAKLTGSRAGFDLHLRSAGLTEADARVLANGMIQGDMVQDNAGNGPFLKSFSASYNPHLGDAGTAALAKAFPKTMTELGLVGCSIGDAGAKAILEWARGAPKLRMICVEGNLFSAQMGSQLKELASGGRNILVVV